MTLSTAIAITTSTAAALKIDAHLRKGETILENCTTAKMQRAGLYAIGSAIPFIAAKASDHQENVILTSLIGTIACFFGASRIQDYEDPRELASMRIDAAQMTFEELV
jgi:hypothetical protein